MVLDILNDAEHDDSFQNITSHDIHRSTFSHDGPAKALTLDSVFKQIGGFGRFQFVAMIIFALIRNLGLYTVYLFGMSTLSPDYECRSSPADLFSKCDNTLICLSLQNSSFEYLPVEGSFKNWYVTMDLVCEEPIAYNGIASYYFIGYLVGIIFFWMPDRLGRRTTINWLLPNYVLSCALVVFG
jgi:MFS family permease